MTRDPKKLNLHKETLKLLRTKTGIHTGRPLDTKPTRCPCTP